ncbi:MD-2-related lipid-recognition protein-like [Ischnura elegans]|uniref:MD-2-related lipid-recognition protein-like n=1 Tax=Ischnura elegans TaxID=197161 RepID=UPI001ED86EE9|nr:MD-2-related lipid-recognition protein-like [Ischnura elegans]
MTTPGLFSLLLLVLGAVAGCLGDVAPFDNCGPSATRCTVHEVRVTPCPEAERNMPCVLKRGSDANIQFDYTTEIPAQAVKSQAYWKTSTDEKPLVGMDRDACTNTHCPVIENQRHTYNNTLSISRKFPPRGYHVKWSMWKEDSSSDGSFDCCFIFRIKLVP